MFAKRLFLLAIGLFCCSPGLFAQWATYTAMPANRWAHVSAGAAGKLYVLGGSISPTWEYDPGTNLWTVRANIPTARSYPAVASYNGKVYVLGGSVGAAWSNKNEMYDPATNTWTTLADMPQVRTTTAAGAVNGKIYVMNGWNGTAMSAVDVYDIATNSWSSAANAPTGRSHAKTAVVGNKIYLIGGYAGGWSNINEVYDPLTNSWQTLAPMPTARYIHAVGELGTTVFAAGGYAGAATNSFQSYDPGSNTWTIEANMPTARYRTDGASVGNCFYVLGGYNGSNLATNEGFCSVILPASLQLKARALGETVELDWQSTTDLQVDYFILERAGEQGEFVELARLDETGGKNGYFSFADWNPHAGTNLYRLGSVNQAGEVQYSAAVEVQIFLSQAVQVGFAKQSGKIALRGKADALQGRVQVTAMDALGRTLFVESFEASPGASIDWQAQTAIRSGRTCILRIQDHRQTITKNIRLN